MLLDLVVGGLFTFRLSSLISKENGPFHVFKGFRGFVGITHDDNGEPVAYPETFFGELVYCMRCNSVWIGAAWCVIYIISRETALCIGLPFALSAVSMAVDRWIHG